MRGSPGRPSVRVEWQTGARQDIVELIAYIDIRNPVAASAVLGEIRRQVAALADHPLMGRIGRVPGTRELVVSRTPYVVAYRIVGAVVQVIRVRHGAQRWPHRF
jgi:toxin ParE1/3/4